MPLPSMPTRSDRQPDGPDYSSDYDADRGGWFPREPAPKPDDED